MNFGVLQENIFNKTYKYNCPHGKLNFYGVGWTKLYDLGD